MASPRDGEESSADFGFLAGLAIAAIVVVMPALASRFLTSLGYPWVGSATWAVGYGVGVVFLWYIWIRPLDISAPEGVGRSDDN
jgi:hypothetical protein